MQRPGRVGGLFPAIAGPGPILPHATIFMDGGGPGPRAGVPQVEWGGGGGPGAAGKKNIMFTLVLSPSQWYYRY